MKKNISPEPSASLRLRPTSLIALLWGCCICTAATTQAADLVLISDHVIPMTDTMQSAGKPLAVAVTDGKISWIGSHQDASGQIDEHTEIRKLGTQALLPGLIDAHGHATFTALATTLANVASPPVGPAENIASLQDTLRSYMQQHNFAPGEWVVGMGYDDSLLAEQRHPNRDDLDAVSTDHPIALMHVSGHLAAANSKALARFGYSAESVDPPGGHIRRHPGSQEPNGVLEESAIGPIRQVMQNANTDPMQSLQAAQHLYASHGITTIQDGAANPDVVNLLQAAAAADQLFLDVVAYPLGMAFAEQVIDSYAFGSYHNGFKVGGVKLSFDGSPQGKTAYLTQPYHVPPHGQTADYRGYPSVPDHVANKLVATYLQAQIPLIVHANGDAAADMLINAVEQARPTHDHRTVMIHAQTAREDQLTSMKRLSMIPSFFSAHTFYWGDWHRDSVLGKTRAERISPSASAVARSLPFTIHNDTPIVPPDMIRLLWATTNRKTRSNQVLGKEQQISTYDALKAMTIYAAYQYFEEADKGSIEVGKRADFVVLSEDPLRVPVDQLMRLQVRQTIVKGNTVYTNP